MRRVPRWLDALAIGSLFLLAACRHDDGSPPSATVTSMTVSGAADIVRGQASQFAAVATWSDGSTMDVTAAATWSSSNAVVASVSATGRVLAENAGVATITARYENVTGTGTVQVTLPEGPTAIAILGTTSLTAWGQTTQLEATARFANGSVQVVTAQAAWSSSDASVFSVERGLVTARANGVADVAAIYQGLAGTRTIGVRASACQAGGTPFNAGVGSGAYEALNQGCQTCHRSGARYDFTGGPQQAYQTALLLVQPQDPGRSKLLDAARSPTRSASHAAASVWPVDPCFPGAWCGDAVQKWIEDGACPAR